MEQLTNAEEKIMQCLWKLEKAFMKDIVKEFDESGQAYTTIATLLTRMIDKKLVGYVQYGNVREYFPSVKKADYFGKQLNGMVKDYFNNSPIQFASFFTNQAKLSKKELTELKKLLEKQIKGMDEDDN